MSKTQTKKKRRSQAPVALVYFITLLLFLAVLGVFAFYLLKQFDIVGNENKGGEPPAKYISFTNLYARVSANGSLSDAAIVKICPTIKKVHIVPISPFTLSAEGDNKTFREVFAKGGILKLKKEISDVYGIEADHYATITPSAFDSCLDIFGGFSYKVPEELYYLDKKSNAGDLSLDKGQVLTLSGRQIRLIASYPVFSAGYQENISFLGFALKESLNNAFRQSTMTSDNMDNLFRIITENSDTDLTKDTFKIQRGYIRDMLRENITPCQTYVPEGDWIDSGHFKPSADFAKKLKATLESTAADESSQESN